MKIHCRECHKRFDASWLHDGRCVVCWYEEAIIARLYPENYPAAYFFRRD